MSNFYGQGMPGWHTNGCNNCCDKLVPTVQAYAYEASLPCSGVTNYSIAYVLETCSLYVYDSCSTCDNVCHWVKQSSTSVSVSNEDVSKMQEDISKMDMGLTILNAEIEALKSKLSNV